MAVQNRSTTRMKKPMCRPLDMAMNGFYSSDGEWERLATCIINYYDFMSSLPSFLRTVA